MTNKEYYADKIIELSTKNDSFAVDIFGGFTSCKKILCTHCKFYNASGDCSSAKNKWLAEEHIYTIPADTPIDTPIWVWDIGREDKKTRRHFAKFENGKIGVFCCGATSWSDDAKGLHSCWDCGCLATEEELAKTIKEWKDGYNG